MTLRVFPLSVVHSSAAQGKSRSLLAHQNIYSLVIAFKLWETDEEWVIPQPENYEDEMSPAAAAPSSRETENAAEATFKSSNLRRLVATIGIGAQLL